MAVNLECLRSYGKAKQAYTKSLKASKGNILQELKMVLELAKLADKAEEAKSAVVELFSNAANLATSLGKPEFKAHVLKTWLDYHRSNFDQEAADKAYRRVHTISDINVACDVRDNCIVPKPQSLLYMIASLFSILRTYCRVPQNHLSANWC